MTCQMASSLVVKSLQIMHPHFLRFSMWIVRMTFSITTYLKSVNVLISGKMQFNPDPNKQAIEVCFSCKANNVGHEPVAFNQNNLSKCSSQKHLGLTLDIN